MTSEGTNSMRYCTSLIAFIVVSFIPLSLFAGDDVVSKTNPCVYENGNPVTRTQELVECAVKDKDEQTLLLNEVWQCVVSKYSRGLKKGYYSDSAYKALLAEQRAWEKFRDSACLPYTYDFGREGHIHFVGCRASLNLQRARYLNGFMDPSTEDTCLGREI